MSNQKNLLSKVLIFYRIFIVVILVICFTVNIANSIDKIKSDSDTFIHDISEHVNNRINSAISLLESIKQDPIISNTALSLQERTQELKKFKDSFGFEIMGITDEDVNVYSTSDKSGNLSRRSFMQELYSTGKNQITDIYTAGENGTLLIYTIAVPIEKNNHVVGSIWCSLKQEELINLITEHINKNENLFDIVLFGSENTVLASSEDVPYDIDLFELNKGSTLFGENIKTINDKLKDIKPNHYYGYKNNKLWYVKYQKISNAPWSIMYRGNILAQVFNDFSKLAFQLFLILFLGIGVDILMRKSLQKKTLELEKTVASIQDIRNKIIKQNEDLEINDQNIFEISKDGLIDNLTGITTRTVFKNVILNHLSTANLDQISILCFIDLDNLKTLNDNFGHDCGDLAIKNTGYILRKYEKMYAGVATRYGGDEFLLFLPNFSSRDEAEKIIKQLLFDLNSSIPINDKYHQTHCSIGAAFFPQDANNIKELITKADQALYKAKRRGKNTYCIYEEM